MQLSDVFPDARNSQATPTIREPQLDGLRCLAFLAVFAIHARIDLFPWGWGGVQVFFALSGFLITRILVRGNTGNISSDLRRYYVRRTLRIFPLYYAILAIVWLAGQLPHPLWFLTYTYNIRGFLDQGIDPTMGHFWTLCVEEQFYLLYPLLLLATPARFRFALVSGLIACAVGFQIYAESRWNIRATRILLPYCGEDLLCGSLAGLIDLRRRPARHEGTTCFLAGLPILVLAWNMYERRLSLPIALQDVAAVSLYSIACSLIVFGASRCTARWLLWPLTLAPVTYLGRISYGLYALHMPVLAGWYREIPFSFLIPRPWGELGLTIGLSALSWKFFEGPINRLKDHIEWDRANPFLVSEKAAHHEIASTPNLLESKHDRKGSGMGGGPDELHQMTASSPTNE